MAIDLPKLRSITHKGYSSFRGDERDNRRTTNNGKEIYKNKLIMKRRLESLDGLSKIMHRTSIIDNHPGRALGNSSVCGRG